MCLILFVSDVLPTSVCASAIGNLGSICLGINNLIPLSFYCLSKSSTFSAILTIDLLFQIFIFRDFFTINTVS